MGDCVNIFLNAGKDALLPCDRSMCSTVEEQMAGRVQLAAAAAATRAPEQSGLKVSPPAVEALPVEAALVTVKYLIDEVLILTK